LPDGWLAGQVKNAATVTLGKMLQSKDSGSDVRAPYMRAANVQPNGVLALDDMNEMWFGDAELKQLSIRAGDVVVVEGGQGGFGRAAYVHKDLAGWGFQNSINRLRPIGDFDGRFIAFYLIALRASGFIRAYSNVVSMPHLTAEKLASIPIPLPPAKTQRAIADYLDRERARIDTLIEEQQRLIRERRAAVIDAALTPLSSWTRTTLKHMLSGVDQGVSPQAEAGLADEPGTWGVLKTGCVNRGVFRPEEHKRLPSDFAFDPAIVVEVGDVIVSRASGSPDLVGSAAIVEHLDYQLILSDKLFRLRPKCSVDPRFLAWGLNSGQYRVQVRRAISGAEGLANNLPLSKLRAFEMHHPSLEEQRHIAAHLDEQTAKINTLIEETERFIELARERRVALITAAVSGQIDVREMV
jgi:type I restriction enzyme S subunit